MIPSPLAVVMLLGLFAQAAAPRWPALEARCQVDPKYRRKVTRFSRDAQWAIARNAVVVLGLALDGLGLLAALAADEDARR